MAALYWEPQGIKTKSINIKELLSTTFKLKNISELCRSYVEVMSKLCQSYFEVITDILISGGSQTKQVVQK